jgi:hypothetical protein
LDRSVPFMPAIRPGRSLGETRHVVVVLVLSVTFERDEVSVRFVSVPDVKFEAAVALAITETFARHAGGGVGMSLKDGSRTLAI